MRVMQVDTEPGFRGGERQVLLLGRALADAGVEVLLAARRGEPLAAAARERDLRVVELPQASPLDPRTPGLLARAIRRHGIDVVHAHSSHSLAAAAAAVRLVDGAVLVASRRVDFSIGRPPWNRLKYGRRVARFLAVSEAVARVLRAGGVEPDRVTVVHSAVEPLPAPSATREVVRRRLGVGPRQALLLTTAALVGHKDHPTAIRAVRRVERDVVLAIAGDGELRREIEGAIADAGAGDRVRLLGHRDDVPDLLAAADVYVASSKLEGLGTALLDAGLARLPVAATAGGGIPEVVIDGETGILVPPGDHRALAAAIDGLVADPGLARRLGEAGRERVLREFSVERMTARTLAVYQEVVTS